MKRLKFLLVFLCLLIGTLTVWAITNDKSQKRPLSQECIEYIGAQLVPSGSDIMSVLNWTAMPDGPLSVCTGGDYLCALCYDNNYTTKFDAMRVLYNYYMTYHSLPPSGSPIPNSLGEVVFVSYKDPWSK